MKPELIRENLCIDTVCSTVNQESYEVCAWKVSLIYLSFRKNILNGPKHFATPSVEWGKKFCCSYQSNKTFSMFANSNVLLEWCSSGFTPRSCFVPFIHPLGRLEVALINCLSICVLTILNSIVFSKILKPLTLFLYRKFLGPNRLSVLFDHSVSPEKILLVIRCFYQFRDISKLTATLPKSDDYSCFCYFSFRI